MLAGVDTTAGYPATQAWAARLHEAGFAGLYYAARHDPELHSRSIALFGKPADPDSDPADAMNVTTEPLQGPLIDDLARTFGYVIIHNRPL